MSDKPEVLEAEEPEHLDQSLVEQEELTSDGMDAVIAVASKMDSYAKAMDTILNHIIKRSYVGDWVCHAKANDKPEDKKANIGSAAAERIASFLGIQERDWSPGVKVMSEDGKSYTWQFDADFGFGKRWIHAIGRASSKDKFFGFAKGEWKELDEIKEDDIRMAAFRNTRKEGVRALLGLRSVPLTKLRELGYDIDKVRMANFEDRGKLLDDKTKEVNKDTGMASKVIIVATMEATSGVSKSTNKPWRRVTVKDTDGTNWIMWAGEGSKREAILRDSAESKAEIKVHFQTSKTDKGEQYTIVRVNDQVDQ